jgi:hypothetical protein
LDSFWKRCISSGERVFILLELLMAEGPGAKAADIDKPSGRRKAGGPRTSW